ncbi:hypothetical protein [Nocardia brasiliensis]|uniref:Resolvase/invertase-type recombinase catalytic domain-containing protein n=1 Tax=Nocardia brasiliensis (strain ATCC 700358 / HUJEG-1) TaxID=1133849 RepID=K0F040_NOCB7|nr:hypothetical protein [Nocardia brasiliensis]AFU03082.1 hypothetical protein O3I_025655 [Nocardia brasiliensis ATCC 700358]OCF84651.1 hypothetical protein AW168_40515 [Nocardia brasiliensis]
MGSEPTALGYLRRDVSGAQRAWDTTQIRNLAKRLGYHLLTTVEYDAATEDPVGQLISMVQAHGLEALITPTLDHLEGNAEPLVNSCDIITARPEHTYARWAIPQYDTGA